MGEAIKFGRGKLVTLDPVFANNDWEKIISACQRKAVPSTWKVGDQKPMTINGVDYPIDIIGISHDDYADGSGKAPLTFQLHDCYATKYGMNSSSSNVGGWTNSAMRNTHLPSVLTLTPTEVQSAVREVKKLTSAGGESSAINTTADKMFLLSEVEVFGVVKNSMSGEGSQYSYYSEGNSKMKTISGVAQHWWLRSPMRTSSNYICGVWNDGSSAQYFAANTSRGVSFAFCF